MHSLEAFDKGQDVHMQANPSLAEMLYQQFKEKKGILEKQVRAVKGCFLLLVMMRFIPSP